MMPLLASFSTYKNEQSGYHALIECEILSSQRKLWLNRSVAKSFDRFTSKRC
ncbi:hypothetical protein D3C81_2247590 [compost metagenome]